MMAWGYWSAATVSDRARSPRRNTSSSFASVSHFASSLPATSILPTQPPAFHHLQHLYGHLQPPPPPTSHLLHHHHHVRHRKNQNHLSQPLSQQQKITATTTASSSSCYNHNAGNVGSESDEEYPAVGGTLSRKPSFADIEFTGPVPAGRPLTLLLEEAVSLSRPPSAMNTYPRSYSHHHHHHHSNGNDTGGTDGSDLHLISDGGGGRSLTAATSTSSLYTRGSIRRTECYLHQQPIIHRYQCHVHHKDYASDDDDEPDPAYATGKLSTYIQCPRDCTQ